jgi:hypothetical protein
MIDWPDDLVRDIAARRSVLFLGAGVSRNAENDRGEHPREWAAFMRHLASCVVNGGQRAEIEQCVDDSDLLTACELARKYLTPSNFRTEMLKEYLSNGYNPTQIHDDLSQVDSRLVMTTNFDRLYGICSAL